MLSRLKDVKESVMLADGMPTPYLTYLFDLIYFIHFNNVLVTDVVTKVRCYWPIFYFTLFYLMLYGHLLLRQLYSVG